jgi:hypothetical protein
MKMYHYTKGCHLPSIVKEGIIRTSKFVIKKEKPAVWLTQSPVWESACNIGKVLNHHELVVGKIYSSNEVETFSVSDEYMRKEIGMCRIVISDELPTITWAKFKHVSRIPENIYKALDEHSRNKGCPVEQWRCTFSPIPRKYWEAIEMFVDGQWVKWDEKYPIEDFVDLCLDANN